MRRVRNTSEQVRFRSAKRNKDRIEWDLHRPGTGGRNLHVTGISETHWVRTFEPGYTMNVEAPVTTVSATAASVRQWLPACTMMRKT
jgi:hypothetical protein